MNGPDMAFAIAYREVWLRDLARMERSGPPLGETQEEHAAYIAAQRALVRRELAALRALPGDAPREDVQRACGWLPCCQRYHGSHDVRCEAAS